MSHVAAWVAVVFQSLSTFSMGFPQAECLMGHGTMDKALNGELGDLGFLFFFFFCASASSSAQDELTLVAPP